jgi:hypothetical protein
MIFWTSTHHLPKLHRNEFASLALGGVVRHVAITLLGLFSPIYIYENLAHLGKTNALNLVFVFYIVLLVFKLLGLIWAEDLSQKLGFKGTIWLSAIPFVVFVPSLVLAGKHPWFFALAAIMWGVHAGFFWWGYHGYFIKSAKKNFGLKIGEVDLLQTLAAILTPIIGAFIIAAFGFEAIFVVSFVFLIASLFIFGRKHDMRQKTDVKIDDILRLVFKHKSVSSAYAGIGGELHLYGVIWPIFIFFLFGSVLDLGIIVSVSALLAALSAVFIGKFVDKRGEKLAINLGSPLMAFSWIFRFTSAIPAFIFADSIRNFSHKLVGVPLTELSYRKAVEDSTGAAMLFREIGLTVGAIVTMFLMIILVYLNFSLSSAFVIAIMFALLPMVAVIRKKI